MIRILDYIFYRTYIAYVKADEPAKISSIFYLIVCLVFFLMPIGGFLLEMTRGENSNIYIFFMILYCLFIFSFVLIRYTRNDKISLIIDIFSDCKENTTIPTWCIWLTMPICMVTGVAGYVLVIKYIVGPYGLSGICYPFFANLFGN